MRTCAACGALFQQIIIISEEDVEGIRRWWWTFIDLPIKLFYERGSETKDIMSSINEHKMTYNLHLQVQCRK